MKENKVIGRKKEERRDKGCEEEKEGERFHLE